MIGRIQRWHRERRAGRELDALGVPPVACPDCEDVRMVGRRHSLRLDGDGAYVASWDLRCPKCGAEIRAGLAGDRVRVGETPSVPLPQCPACGREGTAAVELRRDASYAGCGLLPEDRWPWLTCSACLVDDRMELGDGGSGFRFAAEREP